MYCKSFEKISKFLLTIIYPSSSRVATEKMDASFSLVESLPLLRKKNIDEPEWISSRRHFTGILLALMSTFTFSVGSLILKTFSAYHPFTVSLWRFQGMIIPSIPVLLYYYSLPTTKANGYAKTFGIGPGVYTMRRNIRILLLICIRSLVGCSCILLQIFALDRLSVADTGVIVFSSPVLVTLLAHCFLGEKTGMGSVFIAILTYMGVVIIARPPILTGQATMDVDKLAGILFAIGAMFMAVAVILCLRFLREVHYSLVTLSYGTLGSIQCLVLAIAHGVLDLPHGSHEWVLAAGLMLTAFLAQTLLILALKIENAGPVALAQSTEAVFSFILQYIFLGIRPDVYSLIGAAFVILGVTLTTLRKWTGTRGAKNSY